MKYVLFDLDGTLLPMDQDYFTVCFFNELSSYMEKIGYERKPFQEAMLAAINAMKENDGKKTNEKIFYEVLIKRFGNRFLTDAKYFDDFNRTDFNNVQKYVGFTPRAQETVKKVKASGAKIVLASNPIFSVDGQKARMRWAGVNPDDFDYITCAENSSFCKPKLGYYKEILQKLGANPPDCVMIGNDTTDDTTSVEAGMKFFLITDCLINSKNTDVNVYPHGNYNAMNEFLDDFLKENN